MSEAVVKFGGSLLHQPESIASLQRWLANQTYSRIFLIVGGGECIESMRHLDRLHSLDAVEMHWRCIRLLDATFEIVSELLPQCRKVESAEDFQSCCRRDRDIVAHQGGPEVFLVRIGSYYDANDAMSRLLPASWETTSDALAFLLAKKLCIQELILLKSCDTGTNAEGSWTDWVEQGKIDRASLVWREEAISLRMENPLEASSDDPRSVLHLPFNRHVGIQPSTFENGLLELPEGKQYHNHLGTIHAGAQLALAEACSGEYLVRHFPRAVDVVPVVRNVEAKFRKPAHGRVYGRANVSPELLGAAVEGIESKGRCLLTIDVDLYDEGGERTLTSRWEWFLLRTE